MLYRICLLLLILFSFASNAAASTLAERMEKFPDWERKPSLQIARGDLEYPEWMAGIWNVTSTLLEKITERQSKN